MGCWVKVQNEDRAYGESTPLGLAMGGSFPILRSLTPHLNQGDKNHAAAGEITDSTVSAGQLREWVHSQAQPAPQVPAQGRHRQGPHTVHGLSYPHPSKSPHPGRRTGRGGADLHISFRRQRAFSFTLSTNIYQGPLQASQVCSRHWG